jgi:hypothetical protein
MDQLQKQNIQMNTMSSLVRQSRTSGFRLTYFDHNRNVEVALKDLLERICDDYDSDNIELMESVNNTVKIMIGSSLRLGGEMEDSDGIIQPLQSGGILNLPTGRYSISKIPNMNWKYVSNLHDEKYSKELPKIQIFSNSDFPPEEFEMRQMIESWVTQAFIPFSKMTWIDKNFSNTKYIKALVTLKQNDVRLIDLVIKGGYRAALIRILSVMPRDLPQKAYITKNILNP